ncbi:MAG: hypothetical protein ACTS43_02130 [Candidatus Hodgkinia cicadicola]
MVGRPTSMLTSLGDLAKTWDPNHVTIPFEEIAASEGTGDMISLTKEGQREPYEVICVVAL